MSEHNNLNKNFMEGFGDDNSGNHWAEQINDWVIKKLENDPGYKLTDADVKSILGTFIKLNDDVWFKTSDKIGVLLETIVNNADSIDTCNLIFNDEFKRDYTEKYWSETRKLIEDRKKFGVITNFMDGFKYQERPNKFNLFATDPGTLDKQIEEYLNGLDPIPTKNMDTLKLIFDRISDEKSGVPKEAIDENFIKYISKLENIEGKGKLNLILKTFVNMDLSINDKVFKAVFDFCRDDLKLSDIETNKLIFNFSVTDDEGRQKFLRFDEAVFNGLIEDKKYLKNPAMANSVFRHGRVVAGYFVDNEYDKLLSVMNEGLGQQNSNFDLRNVAKEIFNSHNYRDLSDGIISFVLAKAFKIKDTFNVIIENTGKESKAVQQIEEILGTKEIGDMPSIEIGAIKARVGNLKNAELDFSSVANIVKSASNILIFDKVKDNKELKSVNDKFMQAILNEFLPGFTPGDANKKDFSYTDYVKNFIDDITELLEGYDNKFPNDKDKLKITFKTNPKFSFETNLKDRIDKFLPYALDYLEGKYKFEDIKSIAKGLVKKLLPMTISELKDLNDFGFIDKIVDKQITSYDDVKKLLDVLLLDTPLMKYTDKFVSIFKDPIFKYLDESIKEGKLDSEALSNIESLLTNSLSLAKEFYANENDVKTTDIPKDEIDSNGVNKIAKQVKNLYFAASKMFIKDKTLKNFKGILIDILNDEKIQNYVFDLIRPKEKSGIIENDKKIFGDENARLKKIFESTKSDISKFVVGCINESEEEEDPIKEILDNVPLIIEKAEELSNELKKTNKNETNKDKIEPIRPIIEKTKDLYSEIRKLPLINKNQSEYNNLLVELIKNKDLRSYMFEMLKPSIDELAVNPNSKTTNFEENIFNNVMPRMVDLLEQYIKSVNKNENEDPIEIALKSEILKAVVDFHDKILADPNKSENTTEVINGLKGLFGVIEEKINNHENKELKKAYKALIVTALEQINSDNIEFVINNFVSEKTRKSLTPVATLASKLVFKQAINNMKSNIEKSNMPMTELLNDMPDTSKKTVGLVLSSINYFNKSFKNKVVRSFVFVAEVIVAAPLAIVICSEYVFKFIKSKAASKPLDKVKEVQNEQNKNEFDNLKDEKSKDKNLR